MKNKSYQTQFRAANRYIFARRCRASRVVAGCGRQLAPTFDEILSLVERCMKSRSRSSLA